VNGGRYSSPLWMKETICHRMHHCVHGTRGSQRCPGPKAFPALGRAPCICRIHGTILRDVAKDTSDRLRSSLRLPIDGNSEVQI
jgi:hypothetical protein